MKIANPLPLNVYDIMRGNEGDALGDISEMVKSGVMLWWKNAAGVRRQGHHAPVTQGATCCSSSAVDAGLAAAQHSAQCRNTERHQIWSRQALSASAEKIRRAQDAKIRTSNHPWMLRPQPALPLLGRCIEPSW